MLPQFLENGLHSKTSASARRGVPVPTLLLMALLTNAYGSSFPNPHHSVICTKSTAPQAELITAVLSAEQIVELARLRDFL
jgi:hypothetical protein